MRLIYKLIDLTTNTFQVIETYTNCNLFPIILCNFDLNAWNTFWVYIKTHCNDMAVRSHIFQCIKWIKALHSNQN